MNVGKQYYKINKKIRLNLLILLICCFCDMISKDKRAVLPFVLCSQRIAT